MDCSLPGSKYWSGLPFPSPGDLPDPGIEPRSPALKADALTSEPPGKLPILMGTIFLAISLFFKDNSVTKPKIIWQQGYAALKFNEVGTKPG